MLRQSACIVAIYNQVGALDAVSTPSAEGAEAGAPITAVGGVANPTTVLTQRSGNLMHGAGGGTLRTGERAIVRFRFLYFAEYLLPGATFVFREGRAKGIGKVVETYPIAL